MLDSRRPHMKVGQRRLARSLCTVETIVRFAHHFIATMCDGGQRCCAMRVVSPHAWPAALPTYFGCSAVSPNLPAALPSLSLISCFGGLWPPAGSRSACMKSRCGRCRHLGPHHQVGRDVLELLASDGGAHDQHGGHEALPRCGNVAAIFTRPRPRCRPQRSTSARPRS